MQTSCLKTVANGPPLNWRSTPQPRLFFLSRTSQRAHVCRAAVESKLSSYPFQLLDRVSAGLATKKGVLEDFERELNPDRQHVSKALSPPVLKAFAEVLDKAYAEADEVFRSNGGYSIPQEEQLAISATGGSPTYGELSHKGVASLVRALLPSADGSSVFMDLGSGIGRVVVLSALLSGKAFRHYYGLELSTARNDQAEHVLQQMRVLLGLLPEAASALARVDMLNEDITTSPKIMEATHLFMCSSAFSAAGCKRVVERLGSSPNFQMLITSRELPLQLPLSLTKLADIPLPTTWNPRGEGFVYVKSDLMQVPPPILRQFLCTDGLCALPNLHPPTAFATQEPLQQCSCVRSGLVYDPERREVVNTKA